MEALQEISALCPYCNAPISLLVDTTISEQVYTEDCEVCCQPMVVRTTVSPQGHVDLSVVREDDDYS